MSRASHRRRKSRGKHPGGLPKGAYRLPSGNYVTKPVAGPSDKRDRRIRIIAAHRAEPDADKLARALASIIAEQQLEQKRRAQSEG